MSSPAPSPSLPPATSLPPPPSALTLPPARHLPTHPTLLQGRQHPWEAAYNIGRAAHQLGLVHLAVPYYESVLAHTPTPSAAAGVGGAGGEGPDGLAPEVAAATGSMDLRREAAHNLALIYSSSGAHELAREVLREHLTI